jgi:hypothetical protein
MLLIRIGIRGIFTETHHSSDGPLESIDARYNTVITNIGYNNARRKKIKEARRVGLKCAGYSVYRAHLDKSESVTRPEPKIWLDIVAPNRNDQ